MKLLDELYYYSALLMPLWFQWQWNYVMTTRFRGEISRRPPVNPQRLGESDGEKR